MEGLTDVGEVGRRNNRRVEEDKQHTKGLSKDRCCLEKIQKESPKRRRVGWKAGQTETVCCGTMFGDIQARNDSHKLRVQSAALYSAMNSKKARKKNDTKKKEARFEVEWVGEASLHWLVLAIRKRKEKVCIMSHKDDKIYNHITPPQKKWQTKKRDKGKKNH